MKNMIVMMNAMKYYKHEDLIREDSEARRILAQELSVPACHKVAGKIRQKFFLNRR